MVKTFKEYTGAGIRIGGADSVVPMADLGDNPPKGQGGRDMRGVGLHASAGIKYLIYQTGPGVGKTARIVMKNIKDIQTARNWIKDNGHSFDHKGKNFRIYQYKGNPNNIRPNDLIEQTDLTKDQIKKVHKVADELPKKDFKDRYGKKKGDEVRYGTATNIVKKKLGLEDAKRIPRKPGQKAGSDKHSDLYTDENPRGTIHGLGFTDSAKAKQSVSKIRNSGKTHAHKMQAAIAMSQRAKVASQRAKDPEKKKDLGQAHKVYQSYIDTDKKEK